MTAHRFSSLDARDGWILSGLLAAFVTSRLLWLDWNLPSSIYWEESYRWAAAKEILTAPVIPILDYQADHYQGGSLVMILLAVALFHVFGPSVFVMKVAAVLVSSVILTLLYLVGRRAFDRRTGALAALAYVTGPPLSAYFGLTVMGFHAESTAFSLAQLLLFFGLLAGRWRTPLGWAAFGFVSALGLWFCYTSGVSLAACIVAWPLMSAVPRRREMAFAVAGGMAGLVPWFAYNVPRNFAGLGRLLEVSGAADSIDPFEVQSVPAKLAQLLGRDWMSGVLLPFGDVAEPFASVLKAGFFVPFAVGLALSTAFVALALVSRVRWLRRGEAVVLPPETVFVVYGLIFLVVFLNARFSVDPANQAAAYRVFVPPAVLLLLPAAHAASRALRGSTLPRMVAIVACTVFLASSGLGTLALALRDPSGLRRITTGAGHATRGVLLHRKFETDLARAFAEARRVDDARLHFRVLQGIGWGMEYRFESDGKIDPIRQQLEALPREERPGVLAGIRWSATERRRRAQQGDASLLSGGDFRRRAKPRPARVPFRQPRDQPGPAVGGWPAAVR
jgi:hypothetical protein